MSAPGQDPGRPARATSSEACLRRVACGDREAFDQVYAAFAGPVFGLSRRILRDPAQAEEVAGGAAGGVAHRQPDSKQP